MRTETVYWDMVTPHLQRPYDVSPEKERQYKFSKIIGNRYQEEEDQNTRPNTTSWSLRCG